ncbi:MAG: SPFH domain-containing protein [Candidatus Sericytochromatia bacterium]
MSLFYTIPQNHCVIIERFGKFSSIQKEGLNFKVPILDSIKDLSTWEGQANKNGYMIELSEQKTDTPPRQCQTKDNVTIQANASIYWRIVDPIKAVYSVDILPSSIADIALNTLRANVGMISLDQLLSERNSLNQKISSQLSTTASKWGIVFTRIEIQELTYSSDTAQAMMQEMDAERKRRAKVSEAEGESFSIIKRAESEAKAILIKAEAKAKSLELLAESESMYLSKLKETTDLKIASQILIAQKFLNGLETISENPSNKVFLPNNLNGFLNINSEISNV